jgi:hypothetical protein
MEHPEVNRGNVAEIPRQLTHRAAENISPQGLRVVEQAWGIKNDLPIVPVRHEPAVDSGGPSL